MATIAHQAGETEVSILARFLTNGDGSISPRLAEHVLEIHVSERDKARMHDLAERNQNDGLSPEEKEEMFAFGKATTLLAILKSKARRTLGTRLETRTVS